MIKQAEMQWRRRESNPRNGSTETAHNPRQNSCQVALDSPGERGNESRVVPIEETMSGTDSGTVRRKRPDPDLLYLRGGVWWAHVGGRRQSTGCRDREAALLRRTELERKAAQSVPWRAEHVYFGQAPDGLVKVGFSADPACRMRGIESEIGGELIVLGVIEGDRRTERAILQGFSRFCVGGEWFRPAPELLAFIGAVTSTIAKRGAQ